MKIALIISLVLASPFIAWITIFFIALWVQAWIALADMLFPLKDGRSRLDK